MARTTVSFVCGFVAALLFMSRTSWISDQSIDDSGDISVSGNNEQAAIEQRAGDSARGALRRASSATRVPSSVPPPESPAGESAGHASASVSIESRNTGSETAAREASSRQSSSENRASIVAGRHEPVPTAPEIAELFESREGENAAKAHAELEAQERDAAWSAYMEQEIAAYLFGKLDLVEQFSFPVIHCRSSICEVQAISYNPNALQIWVSSTGDIYSQPWFDFTSASSPVSMSENATVLVLQLRNENKESRPQSEPVGVRRS